MLTLLNATWVHPLWINGVNFNMITKLEEKRGDQIILDNESEHFKEFIQNNWLIDLPFNNGMFT